MLFPVTSANDAVPQDVLREVQALGDRIGSLVESQRELAQSVGMGEETVSRLEIFHGYIGVMAVAFVVTLCMTPVMRRMAANHGIVDRPDPRKVHRAPIAYLGGVAVYLGIMAGIFLSYLAIGFDDLVKFHPSTKLLDGTIHQFVPVSIVLGMTVIMLVGLIDDVKGISPRVKVGGQLFAAAALAVEDVGVRVAQGVLSPTLGALLNNRELVYNIPLPFDVMGYTELRLDLIYWTGTAIIAIFVLGACNASNLIDGLDGLLTGVTSIATAGLMVIALTLAVLDDGPLDAPRLVLCMALLGACLGFLPHNFNPANIFLGDCGSLLLGFSTIVIILSLGDTGKTNLVFAGLVIYSIPIIDTVLAIVRRKLAGKRISDPDDQHLHHMLKRWIGVKGAVLILYALGLGFAGLGIAMSLWKARTAYLLALVFAAYIGVIATKVARKKQIEDQMARAEATRQPRTRPPSPPAASEGAEQPTSGAVPAKVP